MARNTRSREDIYWYRNVKLLLVCRNIAQVVVRYIVSVLRSRMEHDDAGLWMLTNYIQVVLFWFKLLCYGGVKRLSASQDGMILVVTASQL